MEIKTRKLSKRKFRIKQLRKQVKWNKKIEFYKLKFRRKKYKIIKIIRTNIRK